MKVLLSIKPEFVEKIFDGTKKFEYRKSLFTRKDVTSIVIYASSPVMKVVGEFSIKEIISDNVDSLWKRTSKNAGITEEYYKAYFSSKETANAIAIGYVKKFQTPKRLSDYKIIHAPQSFCYIHN